MDLTEHDHLYMFVQTQRDLQIGIQTCPINFTVSDRNVLKGYFTTCSLRITMTILKFKYIVHRTTDFKLKK